MQQKEAALENLTIPERGEENFWPQWQRRFVYLKDYWQADPKGIMPQIEIKDTEGNISQRYYDIYQPGYDPKTVKNEKGIFQEFQNFVNTKIAAQGIEVSEEKIAGAGGQELLQKIFEAGYDVKKSIAYAQAFYNKYRSSWISNVSGEIQLFIDEAPLENGLRKQLEKDFATLFSKIKQEQQKAISRKELIETIDGFLGVLIDLCASQEAKQNNKVS